MRERKNHYFLFIYKLKTRNLVSYYLRNNGNLKEEIKDTFDDYDSLSFVK